jgi:ArsR family transcriptional regulator
VTLPSRNGQLTRAVRPLTELFKSLADEHRVKILFMLAERGEMSVTAIGSELDQSQPAVSHHLAQLKSAGLIEFRRDGKFNYYAISPTGFASLLDRLFPHGTPARLSLGGVEIHFKRKR